MKYSTTSAALAAATIAACAAAGRAQMVLEGEIVVPGGFDSPNVEQEALPNTTGKVTYVAEGQFATAAGRTTCTFSTGDFANFEAQDDVPNNTWFIRTQANPDGVTVEGCQPVEQSGAARNRLPRNSKRLPLNGDKNVANKDMWCFIGDVNSGGNDGDGKANYNALNSASNSKYNEWAYCTESQEKEVRYTVSTSFSTTPGFESAGAPCANEWNFNNNSNGDGIKVGVAQSCLPFADYKPRTEGLDLSGIPEADQAYWCFINTGTGAQGYNPIKTDGSGLDPKTLDWGFCQDALIESPGTSAPSADATAAPTASNTTEETAAPTASNATEATTAPTTSNSTSGTPAPTSSNSTATTPAPSSSVEATSAPTISGAPQETVPTQSPSAAAVNGASLVVSACAVLAAAVGGL